MEEYKRYTVKELIKKLQEFNENAIVEIAAPYENGCWTGGKNLKIEQIKIDESNDWNGIFERGNFLQISCDDEEC